MLARETEPTLVADGVVRLGTELVNWYLVEEDGRVTVVHADDERLATTGKAFGKREASLLPYLRYGHAWRLLGHLATSGFPKKIGAVTTFAGGETLDVPGRPAVLHTPGHTSGHASFWLESRGAL